MSAGVARHRLGLAVRIWRRFLMVQSGLRRYPLPELVLRLERANSQPERPTHPVKLGRAVRRTLSIGPLRPRCLTMALVHLSLLREQGLPAQLVIGLPKRAMSKDAHAWVEVDGADVGPPTGRGSHGELARYGSS